MSNIKDLADPNVDRVLIYAGDAGYYWRQNCGYTYAHTAGVFTRAEAYSLAGHYGPAKRIELHSVPDDHVPTLQSENAALRTAAAGWQALAEKLEACASVFLAEIAIKTGDDGDELTLEFGRLINREKVIEATHTLFEFPTPADVLSAHDWKVRAKALREAEGKLIEKAPGIPDAYDEQGVGKNAAYDECIEILQSMASAAEKETTNAR